MSTALNSPNPFIIEYHEILINNVLTDYSFHLGLLLVDNAAETIILDFVEY